MNRNIICFIALLLGSQSCLQAQNLLDSIKEKEAAKIINVLASDFLRGRGNGSPDLLKAGVFIGNSFKEFGLLPLAGASGYYLPFSPFVELPQQASDMLEWNGEVLQPLKFMYLHPQPGNYNLKQLSDFSIIHIDSCFSEDILYKYHDLTGNVLLWTSKMQPDGDNFFPELIKIPTGGFHNNFLLVYSATPPESLTLSGVPDYYSNIEYNVIGTLPGRSKPGEVIIFSAHYDHVGVYPLEKNDSIMNGANDDASRITAMLLLADYFSLKGDNERTIIFCAFAGEELGLKGSASFVNIIKPDKIVAVINIEMIGVPQYGRNSVFITGEQYSTLPALLKFGLKKAGLKVKPEPDVKKMLYKRSDNYSFVKKGIPAHTIMSSDDEEPCYHKPCDEVRRININHLISIVRGIAFATESLISGKETPER